jgi:hypothetical protein
MVASFLRVILHCVVAGDCHPPKDARILPRMLWYWADDGPDEDKPETDGLRLEVAGGL